MTIAGTGSFRPVSPVVFLNVEDGFGDCVNLHRQLQSGPLERELPFAYHPHVTVAHDVAPESLDEAETVLKDYRATFPVASMGLYEHDDNGIWQLREELDFGTEPDHDRGAGRQQQAPAEPPLPTDLAGLKLEVIRKRVDWGRARRSGGGGMASLMAMVAWLLARLNTLLPMRAFQHYSRQHGPLMSAGIGFRMFFSITGLLATGFSLAGLFLSGQPALLDQIIKSVAMTAPGLLQVDGSEGLVDPYDAAEPRQPGLGGRDRRRR